MLCLLCLLLLWLWTVVAGRYGWLTLFVFVYVLHSSPGRPRPGNKQDKTTGPTV